MRNYKDIIKSKCLGLNLRPDIVACIILQESAGNTFAHRVEEQFYDSYIKNKRLSELSGWTPSTPGSNGQPSIATEKRARSESFGLMQVMGESARSIAKYTNPFLTTLCVPENGIEVGCRILSYYLKREAGNYERALARYNAGRPDSEAGKAYAKKIMDRVKAKEYEAILDG